MKRLLLLRHAKAEAAAADDHNRALIARGQKDSVRIGRFLREDVYLPDHILCSDSRRTRETLGLILPELAASPTVHYLRELYLAEPEVIFAAIRRAPEKSGCLMVVGHNPGLEQAALALAVPPADKKSRKRYDAMKEKFPTCAVAVIDFETARWQEVGPGRGDLDAFVRPKDLEE
ncbi:MAG TPA: histidine phosphatase family protein [Rhizomicrobium sp.]|jgi:phosphohistidine phosphatase|nr:histidine phosphatase family protein [Rhizomicrobium sp.]